MRARSNDSPEQQVDRLSTGSSARAVAPGATPDAAVLDRRAASAELSRLQLMANGSSRVAQLRAHGALAQRQAQVIQLSKEHRSDESEAAVSDDESSVADLAEDEEEVPALPVRKLPRGKQRKARARADAGLGRLRAAELRLADLVGGQVDEYDVMDVANELIGTATDIIGGLAELDVSIQALLALAPPIQDAVETDAVSLRHVVRVLLRDYPPARHVYVGIGASPEVLIGLLGLQGARTASIPVSGVKNAVPTEAEEWDNAIADVARFIHPWHDSDADILLLDATDTKATLDTIAAVIRSSDAGRGRTRSVKSASISQTKTYREPEKLPGSDIDVLEIHDQDAKGKREPVGAAARRLLRERFFFQWYKNNLGRAVEKREFADVIRGDEPEAETNEEGAANVAAFTSAVHYFDSLNHTTLRRAQAVLRGAQARKAAFMAEL
jgi:hypothetical protein